MGKEDTPSDARLASTHSESLQSGENGVANGSSASSCSGRDELKPDNGKKQRKSPFIFRDDNQKTELVELAIYKELWRKPKHMMYRELAKDFNQSEKLGTHNNKPPATPKSVSRAFIDMERIAREEIKRAGGSYTVTESRILPESIISMIHFLRKKDKYLKLKKEITSLDGGYYGALDGEDMMDSEDEDIGDVWLQGKPSDQEDQEESQNQVETEGGQPEAEPEAQPEAQPEAEPETQPEAQPEAQREAQPQSTHNYPQAPPGMHIGPYPFPPGPPGPPQGPPHGIVQGLPHGIVQGLPHGVVQGPPPGVLHGVPQGPHQGPPQGHQGYTPRPPHLQAQKPLGEHEPKGPMFNTIHLPPSQHQIPPHLYPQIQHQGVYPPQQTYSTNNTDGPAVVYNPPIITGPPHSTSEHETGTEGDRDVLIRRIAGAVTDFEANLTQRLIEETTSSKKMVDNWHNSMKQVQDEVDLLHKLVMGVSSKLDSILELLQAKK